MDTNYGYPQNPNLEPPDSSGSGKVSEHFTEDHSSFHLSLGIIQDIQDHRLKFPECITSVVGPGPLRWVDEEE